MLTAMRAQPESEQAIEITGARSASLVDWIKELFVVISHNLCICQIVCRARESVAGSLGCPQPITSVHWGIAVSCGGRVSDEEGLSSRKQPRPATGRLDHRKQGSETANGQSCQQLYFYHTHRVHLMHRHQYRELQRGACRMRQLEERYLT